MNTLPARGSFGVLLNGGVVSPGWRARQISTRVTPTLSRAQPVTAMEPDNTVESPAGVSTTPKGGAIVVGGMTDSDTSIGSGVFDAPLTVNVMAPVTSPVSGRLASNLAATLKAAGPEPEPGVTVSQGRLDVAVQENEPSPDCVRRTTWAVVVATSAVPVRMAARTTVDLSIAVDGMATSTTTGRDSVRFP
jgi:hypothetical protein